MVRQRLGIKRAELRLLNRTVVAVGQTRGVETHGHLKCDVQRQKRILRRNSGRGTHPI